MPKIKSHSGAAKRFKKTGTGKIKYKSSNARHILTSKSPKRKRNLRGTAIMSGVESDRINKMAPYL